MSLITQTINKEARTEIEYPDIDGFKVQLAYLSREELTKIRTKCLVYKFNKASRAREEVVDSDKFLKEYATKAVLGWSGLKVKDLPSLYPANIEGMNPEDDVPYDSEDALVLLQTSVDFDQFVTDAMSDLDNFNKEEEKKEIKNLKTSSGKS